VAASRSFSVALVLHSGRSDWSQLQEAGIRATLEGYGSALANVVECGFEPEHQAEAMQQLLESRPDAIISIPVGSLRSGEIHRRISEADIKLVVMDNAPVGMVARKDYSSVVSADNFGNGEIAASILAAHIPQGGRVTVVGYGVDFPVTNERELGFRRQLGEERPDVAIRRIEFKDPSAAGEMITELVATDRPDAVFVVWDEPALLVSKALSGAGLSTPIATVDLGTGVAEEIARGGLIVGGGAQLPFDQGVAEATAVMMALAGDDPPPWIALPALAVTRENIAEAYEEVWHGELPAHIRRYL
jgi:ribose transport system substrate-binding protein